MGRICSEAEIKELEKKHSLVFPTKYREFLLHGDSVFQQIMQGSDFHPPYLENLNEWARELLEENGSHFSLKDGDFVFSMHQGYQFLFFNCSEDPADPPVYYYPEGEDGPRKSYNSFTNYLTTIKRESHQ